MGKLLLILLFAVFAHAQSDLIGPRTPAPKFDSSYDKFKDQTRVSVATIDIAPTGNFAILFRKVELKADFIYAGSMMKTPPHVFVLTFISEASGWQFLEASQRKIIFLVDGQRISATDAEHNGSIQSDEVTEFVSFGFSRAELESIAKGKKVEFQLGSLESSLTDADKKQLTNLLDAAVIK